MAKNFKKLSEVIKAVPEREEHVAALVDELHAVDCVHHYRLDQENYGICKKCGAEKQFIPVIPDSYREYGTVRSDWLVVIQEMNRVTHLAERVAGMYDPL